MPDIDDTNPADNAIVSQYPTNERASRKATEDNLYLEHGIDVGRHKFGVGNDAARDAITNWFVGGFWLNTSRTPVILQRVISIDPDVWEDVERTNAQTKTAYEANADTNEFSDAEQTKLAGVESNYEFGGFINGLQLANSSGDAVNDIDVGIGVCAPDNAAVVTQMKLTTLITKRIDANWVVGTNQGGFPSAISLTNDTWYHVFLIKRTDTGVVDAGFDTSLTAVNLLALATNYNAYRRIGSVRRATALNRLFFQIGNDFLWDVPIQEVSANAPTTRTLLTLTVPTGVKVKANICARQIVGASSVVYGLIYDPDLADSVPSATLFNFNCDSGGSDSGDSGQQMMDVWTDTSSRIAERYTLTANRKINLVGWHDLRGHL